jgi:glycerol-3-phosphate acyltransferase PlsY
VEPQVAPLFRFATTPRMTREMLFALALGYLFGSVPFGLVLTRIAGKGDIRSIGSGNIGATNVLRTGSKWLAALTLILDCLKATAAILIAQRLLGDETGVFAAAGALIGHLYPVWLNFRGGKGVATLLGILIGLQFREAALVYALLWILLLLTLRISSVAGMTAAVSAPITAAILHSSLLPMLLGFAVLVLWKHRENLARLRRGTEPRIGRAKL